MTTPDKNQLPDTRQSVIADAILPPSSTAVRDLTRFCEAYWFPIFATIRRKGYTEDSAEDLTQDLFAKILDPARNPLANFDNTKGAARVLGKFRTFMLWHIEGLSDANRKAKAEKRGGKLRPLNSFGISRFIQFMKNSNCLTKSLMLSGSVLSEFINGLQSVRHWRSFKFR